jgi:steroid delta-isomerase-like uncharacterized protein
MFDNSSTLVERFYGDIWNRRDYDVAEKLLAADFRFRGSLGNETVGIPAFLAYVDSVHAALADYRCTIEELIADGHRASARMVFAGRHRAPLLGVAATDRNVSWAGAAFFTIAQGRIASLWVLGDIVGLKRQLEVTGDPPS